MLPNKTADQIIDIVCVKNCSYYKGKKGKLRCSGLEFLIDFIEDMNLKPAILKTEKKGITYRFDSFLMNLICDRCKFRKEDCDYRGLHPDAQPCGGYIVLSLLLEEGVFNEKDVL